MQHQRAGNGDALALAAGEHVRISRVLLGPEADLGHHGARRRLARLGVEIGVDDHRLFQDRAHLLARIERAIGILEDHLDDGAQSASAARRRPSSPRCRRSSGCRRSAARSSSPCGPASICRSPNSPTTASVLPAASVKLTPSTALRVLGLAEAGRRRAGSGASDRAPRGGMLSLMTRPRDGTRGRAVEGLQAAHLRPAAPPA